MASFILFCLTFLVISCSISLCTVDIFQSQDRSTCYGMKADVTCITVVAGGTLQWSIDGNTVFTVGSGRTDSFNQTVNGSTFVFVRGSQLPGQNIYTYTSTVSLATNKTRSISCSDEIVPETFETNLIVEDQPSDSSTSNNREDLNNSVNISWKVSADAGICCVQYRVVSSDGRIVNTTATSFTLYNIRTCEDRDNAFISVRCMDQIGTMGPEVIYRPDFENGTVTVSNPEHVGYSGGMPMYEVRFNLPEISTEVAVSLVHNCTVTVIVPDDGDVVQQNCDPLQSRASFMISDLSPFRVVLTFDYGLGFESTDHSSPLNGAYFNTSTLMDARMSEGRARQITALEGRNTALEGQVLIIGVVLGVLLLISIIINAILILVIVFKLKPKEDYPEKSQELTPPNRESIKM